MRHPSPAAVGSATRSFSLGLGAALLPLLLAACAGPAPRPAEPAGAAPVLAPPASATAEAPLPPPPYGDKQKLAAWVDAYVGTFGSRWGEAHAFTGYLAVARGGVLEAGKGYGKADRARGTVPDADTLFRIGSLTKQITAVAVMQLAQRGKVRLEDPVGKYVPGLASATAAVTLHQLLTHTSGIRSYTEDAALRKARGRHHAAAEVVATFKDAPLAFAPGERFAYSNSNYFLLGLVIEKASGQTYEAFLQESVFRPAGMKRSTTIEDPAAPNAAAGYVVGDSGERVPAEAADMSVPYAAGAVHSTANDLIAWDRALTGEVLLSTASKKRLFTPEKEDYAYGVDIGKEEGHVVHTHSGGIDGFSAFLVRVPDLGLAIVALSNDESFPAVKVAIPTMRMALTGAPVPPKEETAIAPMDLALAARIAGEYELSGDSRTELAAQHVPAPVLDSIAGMRLTVETGRLFMTLSGQGRTEFFLSTEGKLFAKTSGLRLAVDPAPTKPGVKAAAPTVSLLQGPSTMRYLRKGGAAVSGGKKGGVARP